MGVTASNNPFSCDPAILQVVGDYLVSKGTITYADYFVNLSLGFSCRIDNVLYSNTEEVSRPISPTLPGLRRVDFVVMNAESTFEIIQGPVYTDVVVEPLVPDNTVFVTAINVFGDTVTVQEPIPGGQFVEKQEFSENLVLDSGDVTLVLDQKATSYRLTGAVTSLKGFDTTTLFNNSNIWINKVIKVSNNTGSDVPVSHNNVTVDVPARFPSEADFVWKNNEVITFKLVKTDALIAEFDSVGRDTEIDISGKQNISEKGQMNGYASLDGSGKVPSSQLPSYVDDVIEVANLAALPVTGETGKIYVTINDNRQYRWSGSLYVVVNYKEKFHKVIRQKQMAGGLFATSYLNNPVFTDRYVIPDYNYTDIITNSAVFDFKIIFDKKVLVSKFLKVCGQFVSDDIKTCHIHAITNISHVVDSAADTVLSNFPLIFNNHDGSDAVFPTSTAADFGYYLNNQDLVSYNIQTPIECYGIRIIGKSNMGNTARYAITKFLFS